MAASTVTGEVGEIRLGQGVIRYREVGEGPILLFVHGILANGTLGREVVPRLSGKFRCVVPDLPLGGHAAQMDQGTWRSSSLASSESGRVPVQGAGLRSLGRFVAGGCSGV